MFRNFDPSNNKKYHIMTTFTTSYEQEFTVDYASSLPSGYGHRKINVEIVSDCGSRKTFSHSTSNMPDFDEANDLEGREKYEALFGLVENSLEGEISEWIFELENQ